MWVLVLLALKANSLAIRHFWHINETPYLSVPTPLLPFPSILFSGKFSGNKVYRGYRPRKVKEPRNDDKRGPAATRLKWKVLRNAPRKKTC